MKEITARAWACISMLAGVTLTLLDLRGDGCPRIGAPTDTVNSRSHAAGRAYAKAIHVDGFVDASHLSGEDAYAVFDRPTGKLASNETGLLEEHQELPNVLRRYGISLVTWE